MRPTLYSILSFLLISPLYSQNIKVYTQDLFPIANVQVSIEDQLLGSTDEEGLLSIPDSNYSFKVFVFVHPSYHAKLVVYEDLKQNDFTAILYPKTGSIPSIIVTSERVKRLRNDLAVSLERIEQKDIQLYQPQTAADLVGSGEKVYIQKSQMGGGSPMMRGFATNRILLVVDDVRMNTAIFRSGNVQNSLSIDPYTIEETEIIFGPASQFYGSDAIGGVLNFKTNSIDLLNKDSVIYEGNAKLRFSTVNAERSLHMDFKVRSERWGSYSSISLNQFGDLRMGSNGPDTYLRPDYVTSSFSGDTLVQNEDPELQRFTEYSQLNLLQKIRLKASESIFIDYGFYYSIIPSNPRYDRLLVRDSQDSLRHAHWSYGPQSWLMNRLQIEQQKKSGIYNQLKLTLAHQHFRESREDRRFGSSSLRDRREKVNALSANLDFFKRFEGKARFHYGVEYLYNYVSSSAELSSIDPMQPQTFPIASRYPDGSTWQSAGLYINYFKRFNKWYKLESGARYNLFSIDAQLDTSFYPFPFRQIQNSNGALTASVAQLFQSQGYKLGLITSTAYRAPNIDDVAKIFDSSPGTVVIPNADLGPEYAYNLELNFESPQRKMLQLFASLFYTRLQGAISRQDAKLNGQDSILYDGVLSQVQQLQNTDFAIVYGGQFNVKLNLDAYWSISSAYTFLFSDSENGDPIRHITPNFGGTHVVYQTQTWKADFFAVYQQAFPFEKFNSAEINDAYLYTLDENGNPFTPGFVTLNFKMQKQFNAQFRLHAGIENILDKRYRTYASGITAAGRNFFLAVSLRF